jgi:hypothetical protein
MANIGKTFVFHGNLTGSAPHTQLGPGKYKRYSGNMGPDIFHAGNFQSGLERIAHIAPDKKGFFHIYSVDDSIIDINTWRDGGSTINKRLDEVLETRKTNLSKIVEGSENIRNIGKERFSRKFSV